MLAWLFGYCVSFWVFGYMHMDLSRVWLKKMGFFVMPQLSLIKCKYDQLNSLILWCLSCSRFIRKKCVVLMMWLCILFSPKDSRMKNGIKCTEVVMQNSLVKTNKNFFTLNRRTKNVTEKARGWIHFQNYIFKISKSHK